MHKNRNRVHGAEQGVAYPQRSVPGGAESGEFGVADFEFDDYEWA